MKKFTRRGVLGALLIAALAYVSPCLFSIGFMLLLAALVHGYGIRNYRLPGRVIYTHEFFGDNRFTGWKIHRGNETTYTTSTTRGIPQEMRDAARRAVNTDPYLPNGDVIVETRVEMENGAAIIMDGVVTHEQIQRMERYGFWDNSDGYTGNIIGVNIHSGDIEYATDEKGRIELPAPTGLEHQFMSQFNGPKIIWRKRK